MGDPTLLQTALQEPSLVDSYRFVHDNWHPNTGWKWEELNGFLPTQIENILLTKLIRVDDEDIDGEWWGMTTSGPFTIRSSYGISLPNQNASPQDIWKKIWKLELPQKIRMFMWLVYHGKLLKNNERMHRGLTANPNCHVCRDKIEDLDQLFRSCPSVQELWGSSFGTEPISFNLRNGYAGT